MILPNPRFRIYKSAGFYRTILSDILTGRWRRGDDVAQLEERVCQLTGTPHAVATAQARVAIYLSIRAIIQRSGRRDVVMSPYTIFDVVNMVVAAGGRPVFADLDPGTCNISADEVERALSSDSVAAVLVTHLQGLACDIERIAEMCDRHGVALVEDAAQALGTLVDGRQVGTFGDVGILSFGLAKNVNCVYGGMVLTRDPWLASRVRETQADFPEPSLSWIVKRAGYALATDFTLSPIPFKLFFFWLFRFGYLHEVEFLNKRVTVEDHPVLRREFPPAYRRTMSPLQARLVLKQLDDVAPNRETRRRHARLYWEGLRDLRGVTLPPWRDDASHSYLVFSIQVEDRRALVAHLMRDMRDCAYQHLKNCADLPCFEEFARDCPVAAETADRNVLLPTYPTYGEEQVKATIRSVRRYFGAEAPAAETAPWPSPRPASHSP